MKRYGEFEESHLMGFFSRALRLAGVRLHPSGREGKTGSAVRCAVDSGETGVGGNAVDERGVREFFFGVSNVPTGTVETAIGVSPVTSVAASIPGVGGAVTSPDTCSSAVARPLATTESDFDGDSVTSEFGWYSFLTLIIGFALVYQRKRPF
jgi:hypothetical protein